MPNWCTNVVTFEHENPAMIRKIIRGYNKDELLSEFFPCPEELRGTIAGAAPAGTPAAKDLEIQQQLNKEKHGFADWYDWQLFYWGTKWDVGRGEDGPRAKGKKNATAVTVKFESAWSPPIPFYERLAATHGFKIEARYFEPGMGFVGACTVYETGEISDRCFDYSSAPAGKEIDYIKDHVPQNLINEFNLLQECADLE